MIEKDAPSCSFPADWASNFSQCLYDWQALEAGALAIVAAIVSVVVLRRQIKQQQLHRDDEIARRHLAARIKLPLALASISQLITTISNAVGDEFETFGPDGARTIAAVLGREPTKQKFDSLELPAEVLATLADFVASHNAVSDRRHVAELVASIQILLARYNGFDLNQPAARHNLSGLLLDAAKVQLLVNKMYNYARFVDDSCFGQVGVADQKQVWDEIHEQAQGLVFARQSPDIFFPELQRRIEGYKKQGTNPWNEKFGE